MPRLAPRIALLGLLASSVCLPGCVFSNPVESVGREDLTFILSDQIEPDQIQDPDNGSLITWAPTMKEELSTFNSSFWEISNWSNGEPFACTWQLDNVTLDQGKLFLNLDNKGCPKECDAKPYASGEFRSIQEKYGFGYYETRMKPAKGDGLVSSFFIYSGIFGTQSHHEINFEFLGKDTTKGQLNYFVSGQGGHEKLIDLGFDASKGFHNYGFKWTANSLTWHVDGVPVHAVNGVVPYKPGKIMANFWPGTGVDEWLDPFNYSGPIRAEYDWIAYSTLAGAKP